MRKFLIALIALGAFSALIGSARADDQAALKAVIDKAVKAKGGAENLAKLQAEHSRGKGKVHVMGMELEFTGDWKSQGMDKFHVHIETEVMGMKIEQHIVLNKDQGWMRILAGGADQVIDLPKEMLDEQKQQVQANWVIALRPFALKETGYEFASLGDVKVENRPAVGVKVTKKGQRDVSLFFDKENHLLLKAEFRAMDEAQNEVNQEMYMSEYKEFDGIKEATKVTMKRDGKPFLEMDMTEYELLEKLDENIFKKP